MRYLLRDDASGFREMQGEPLDGGGGPLRPWAVTADGRVVYAEWKHQGSGTQGMMELAFTRVQTKVAVRTYDKAVSLSRRREFETALALDASAHPGCIKPAIDRVTAGLLGYVGLRNTDAAGEVIKARCYNDTGSGRMGSAAAGSGLSNAEAWKAAVEMLRGNDIPKIIGIQSSIANVLSRKVPLTGGQLATYKDTGIKVAPSQGISTTGFLQIRRGGVRRVRELRRRRRRVSRVRGRWLGAMGRCASGALMSGRGWRERTSSRASICAISHLGRGARERQGSC